VPPIETLRDTDLWMIMIIVTDIEVSNNFDWVASYEQSEFRQCDISELIHLESRIPHIFLIQMVDELGVGLEDLISQVIFIIGQIGSIKVLHELQKVIVDMGETRSG